jgi:hypothetical protein
VKQHEILLQYQAYKDVFRKKNVDMLIEHQWFDYVINFEEGAWPPFGPIYNLFQDELMVLREYIDENLEKGLIWHSKSLVSAPILFVKKKDGFFLMCVNYCGLSQLIIKNQYLVLLIPSLLDELNHTKVFTKVYLCGAYNLMCIQEGDEWKNFFWACYGHFEYVVMPFGLVDFQHLMNDVFKVLGWFHGL